MYVSISPSSEIIFIISIIFLLDLFDRSVTFFFLDSNYFRLLHLLLCYYLLLLDLKLVILEHLFFFVRVLIVRLLLLVVPLVILVLVGLSVEWNVFICV